MKLTKQNKETLWFYAAENFLMFLNICIAFGLFCATEDIAWLGIILGMSGVIVLNELRSRL